MARRLAPFLGVAVLLVGPAILVVGALRGGDHHTMRAAFVDAVQVAPGQEVRIAGRKVGSIDSVEAIDGHAVLTFHVDESDVWPLRRGTRAGMRWGSTTSYASRYLELYPGPASAPALPAGGLLSRADTVSPVELDQLYRIYRGRTRGDLQAVIGELGDTFRGNAGALSHALRDGPAGLEQSAEFLRELGADEASLRTLTVAGDRTATALASRDGELRGLVTHAAGTFDELARHAGAQRAALERLPATLSTSRGTLRRLDVSLGGLDALVKDLGPGARALRGLSVPARLTLAELRSVAPLATATLARGRRAAPDLGRFLQVGTAFLPRLSTDLAQLVPMAACLRPYGPEIGGTLSTWTGFGKNYDNTGHYLRAFPLQVQAALLPGTRSNSEQSINEFRGRLFYAFPRPPGLNAGHPWFQPQCGAGPQALDPRYDPEGAGARR